MGTVLGEKFEISTGRFLDVICVRIHKRFLPSPTLYYPHTWGVGHICQDSINALPVHAHLPCTGQIAGHDHRFQSVPLVLKSVFWNERLHRGYHVLGCGLVIRIPSVASRSCVLPLAPGAWPMYIRLVSKFKLICWSNFVGKDV